MAKDPLTNPSLVELHRHRWLPVLVADALIAGGRPVRVRLFGQNLVAFRAADGQLGLLDARCPHAGGDLFWGVPDAEVSGLRCAYHGWVFDTRGQCLGAPLDPYPSGNTVAFPLREAGAVVWAFMGDGPPPPGPSFEWLCTPSSQRVVQILNRRGNSAQRLAEVPEPATLPPSGGDDEAGHWISIAPVDQANFLEAHVLFHPRRPLTEAEVTAFQDACTARG